MALTLPWSVNDTTYPDAYARVVNVVATSLDSWVVVNFYADEAARWSDAQPVACQQWSTPTATLAGDIYPAAYAFLKTLPEFAGAVDVLVNPMVEPPATAPEPAPEPQPTQAPAEA